MRVSKMAASKVANEALDEWFSLLGDSQISTKLKFYSQVSKFIMKIEKNFIFKKCFKN